MSSRAQVEEQVLKALRKRDFKKACLAVASFEVEQKIPRGLNINWKHYKPDSDIARLNYIWEIKPKILRSLSDVQFDVLRLAVGMMELWGESTAEKWLPRELHLGLRFDNDTATRMLLFAAYYRSNLEGYRSSGVVRAVKILTTNDPHSCLACRQLTNHKFSLDAVPELPYTECTSEMGCRCTLTAVI